jgi:Amt family ammonium transporter
LSGTDPQIGIIATTTILASAAGAAAGMITSWFRFGRPDPGSMCNGMLAGLVAISSSCAFVESWAAVLIGLFAGALVVYSVAFVGKRLRIDDPVGAISVHGTSGIWGALSLGLFGNGRYGEGWNGVQGKVTGLLYGDVKQFYAEIIGTAVCCGVVFLTAYTVFYAIGLFSPHRAPVEDQVIGLDQPELGVLGYQPDAEKFPR